MNELVILALTLGGDPQGLGSEPQDSSTLDPRIEDYLTVDPIPSGSGLVRAVNSDGRSLVDGLVALERDAAVGLGIGDGFDAEELRGLLLEATGALPDSVLVVEVADLAAALDDSAQAKALCRLIDCDPELAGAKEWRALADLGPEFHGDFAFEWVYCSALTHALETGAVGGRWMLREFDGAARGTVIRALGRSVEVECAEPLCTHLGWDPELDGEILAALGVITPWAPVGTRRIVCDAVTAHLRRRSEPSDQQSAANCLAALGWDGAAYALIPLLDSPSPGVAKTAWRGLLRLSGMRLPQDSRLWWHWLSSEEAWHRHDSGARIRALTAGDPAAAIEAIQALGARQLHRATYSDALLPALHDRSKQVRIQACLGLQRLGQASSVAALEELFRDPDLAVAEAARAAVENLLARNPRTDSAFRRDH